MFSKICIHIIYIVNGLLFYIWILPHYLHERNKSHREEFELKLWQKRSDKLAFNLVFGLLLTRNLNLAENDKVWNETRTSCPPSVFALPLS